MQIKTMPVSFKAGPADGLAEGEFLVYPSTFTKTPDAYGDIVAPGAFADDIAEWKASGLTLPGLYGHRMDDPDYFVASALDMGEDDHGWWVHGAFDLESAKGPAVYRLVKGKRLNQLSFAYDTLDEGSVQLPDGTKANELRKLKTYEFSFVPVGANQDTSVVAVKSAVLALVDGVKAGRVLSAKNEETLRAVLDALGGATSELKNVLSQLETGDQGKASGHAATNDEEPESAKSEESRINPSARALGLINISIAQ